jgi:hypothetical protein
MFFVYPASPGSGPSSGVEMSAISREMAFWRTCLRAMGPRRNNKCSCSLAHESHGSEWIIVDWKSSSKNNYDNGTLLIPLFRKEPIIGFWNSIELRLAPVGEKGPKNRWLGRWTRSLPISIMLNDLNPQLCWYVFKWHVNFLAVSCSNFLTMICGLLCLKKLSRGIVSCQCTSASVQPPFMGKSIQKLMGITTFSTYCWIILYIRYPAVPVRSMIWTSWSMMKSEYFQVCIVPSLLPACTQSNSMG